MDVSQVTGNNNGYLWVICSFTCFVCSNYVLGGFVPSNARKTPHHIWKWKNIANSFLHSFISGSWAMLCFFRIPEMKEDLLNNYAVSAHGVISLSVGYFFYDLFDMAIHDRKRSFDLIIHHILVILCFGLSVCTCYYQGFSLLALLVEVNSVFLHLRQLMLLHGVQKSSSLFQANGVINLATFVVFRVFTMGGMFHWLLSHRSDLTAAAFGLGVFSLAVLMGMNFQLLSRVLKSDYGRRPLSSGVESQGKGKQLSQSQSFNSRPEKLVNGNCSLDHHQDLNPINAEFVAPIACGKLLKLE